MSNIITIADVAIHQDEQGRFSLNDLHRAAIKEGANERTKEPSKFISSSQTIDLITELIDTQNLGIAPVNTIKGGVNQGTYVVKELVYAYGMWISAAFHLKVIRAYDQMQAQPKLDPLNILNDPRFLRQTLLGYSEKVIELEAKVQEQAPKVQAHDRIAEAGGAITIRETATTLEHPERKLVQWLIQNGWAYRRNGRKNLLGYAETIRKGWLAHKVRTIKDAYTGEERISEQLLVTPLGLTELAKKLQGAIAPSYPIPAARNKYLAIRG